MLLALESSDLEISLKMISLKMKEFFSLSSLLSSKDLNACGCSGLE